MSDKTDPLSDPRYTVIAGSLMAADLGRHIGTGEVLDQLDAADRAAGIVRVDTRDEALVERLAEQMLAQQIEKGMIGESTVSALADLPPAYREAWFREARAALGAVLAAAAGGER